MSREIQLVAPALESTAQALLASGKGLLAADESFPTIGKRFAALHIPSTGENRRDYRALQDAALKTWKGSPASATAAQAALHHRAKCNGLAVQGKYSEQAERESTQPKEGR